MPRSVPRRRNLSSSKPRILPAFAATKSSVATILRSGNGTLKLLCEVLLYTYISRFSVDPLYQQRRKTPCANFAHKGRTQRFIVP
ncbi:hypothetical protein SAMN05216343_10527 [Oscillibacter sp. PC13]|nr:hypothetical protein SAMN05216343_10527 [Oscillibacter sp. PC13]